MNKSLALIFSAVVCLSTAHALNLQPREVAVEKDGPPMRRYFFQDEGKRLLFRIDGNMSVAGSTNEAVFRFSDIRNAAMKLSKSGMKPQIPETRSRLRHRRCAKNHRCL